MLEKKQLFFGETFRGLSGRPCTASDIHFNWYHYSTAAQFIAILTQIVSQEDLLIRRFPPHLTLPVLCTRRR